MISSLPAHLQQGDEIATSVTKISLYLRILPMLARFIPMLRFRSQRYLSNPSAFRSTDTRDTWEVSIAWQKMSLI